MKKKRYSEEQIIKILSEHSNGKTGKEIAREYGVAIQTIYAWKRKFGDMDSNEVKRLKSLEQENARLKRLVADQALDIQILKDVNSKKW